MSEVDRELRQRILDLERQVLALRKHLRRDDESLGEESFKVLEVRVGDAWYALRLSRIHEVVAMLRPEPVPETPDWVLGTFLYGDEVVTMVDLRRRLDGVATEIDPSLSLLLVHDGSGGLSGFAVEEVRRIFDVEPRDVVEPRDDVPQAPYVLGTLRRDDRLLHVLSTERLSRELLLDTEESVE